MKRRTFLGLVPATAATTAGCVVQDRSSALGGSQTAPEAKAIVDFEYHAPEETVTITLVRATGFTRDVVGRVFVVGAVEEDVVWIDADRPSAARTRLPLDDGDSLTVDALQGEELRVVVELAEGESTSTVGAFEVPEA